ncbi:hypothetical protein F8M49_29850 [Rhodococcus zopfii]|uniref:Uncharacterized protein n=1 Tax=Rhodococcus zopfii TaxID=43772 RepID=A0ABU3WXS9_9NOCA|nr:hypothetical protein [Rhodococcus zopfii]
MRIELANVRTYPTGIAFDLVAHARSEQSAPLHQWVNLGPHVGTKRVGRIYLGLVLPDGSIVTNKKSLAGHAPENSDTTTPWLYGGPVHREPTRVAATYFLSPRPEPGESVAITLSYKEIGINSAAELVVDSERFAPVEQPHDD